MFRKVVIVGVGQLGASIGMNLIAKKMAKEVVGVGRDPKNLREAIRRKAIHRGVRAGVRVLAPLLRELSSNDLIILATPVGTIRSLLKMMPRIPLMIDVGSTKSSIVAEAARRRLRFVGCHPIAGTEVPGAGGADQNLFRGKMCLVTPSGRSSSKDMALVRGLWRRLGASTEDMRAEAHDRLLAEFSHLPHAIAYALMANAPVKWVPKKLFSGLGGFRGATRVAASSPDMWRDIFLENRGFVLSALDRYSRELKNLRKLMAGRDGSKLRRYLAKSQEKRREIQ